MYENMKKILLLIVLLSTSLLMMAQQGIKGQVVSQEGEPIPFATVYIESLKQGTTSNAKGEFSIRLDPGKYTVLFQSLGYMATIEEITITNEFKTLKPVLYMQYYQIQEVRITSSGEDPAYSIMRKAIAMAPYYLNHIKNYKADIYLKGTLVINKIPRILERQLEKEQADMDIKVGELYLMESFNEVNFEAPDIYKQKVISFQSNFPGAEGVSPMDYINASLYQPEIEVIITPFSPSAFNHYKFEYQGSTFQAQYIINKIKVIPKRKSQQLVEGTLYIIEDLWCLHSADLTNDNMLGKIHLQQLYAPVNDGIWMPVSHKFDVAGKILGIQADFDYGGSVRYHEVTANTDLEKPDLIKDLQAITYPGTEVEEEPVEEVKTKNQEKIEEIVAKEDLTTRDMVKLSRLMEKEAKESKPEEEQLEIKQTTTYEIAEGAAKKDSAYWNRIRPVPLSSDEQISIARIEDKKHKLAKSDSMQNTNINITLGGGSDNGFLRVSNDILFGEQWRLADRKLRIRHDGLLKLSNLGFNTVDGFHYGLSGRMIYSLKDTKEIRIYPYAGYNFSRQNMRWRVNAVYDWKGMNQTSLSLRAGHETQDFNRTGGINSTLNLYTSLLLMKNYLKLYDRRYLQANQRWEWFNGFYVELKGLYEDRRVMTNNTDFSLFRKKENYTTNEPDNPLLHSVYDHYFLPPSFPPGYFQPYNQFVDHEHLEAEVKLSYTPRQRYRIVNDMKFPAGSDHPTYVLTYQQGWNTFKGADYQPYGHLSAEAYQQKNLGAFYEYRWRIRTGTFLQKENASFPDYKHFNTQNIFVLFSDYADGFFLLPYYQHSTPEYYIEAHGKYTTPYFLLKLLPWFSNKLMRENLHLNYMYTPMAGHYTELGYGLSEVFLLGQVNVYAGFRNLEYEGVGVRVVLNLQ